MEAWPSAFTPHAGARHCYSCTHGAICVSLTSRGTLFVSFQTFSLYIATSILNPQRYGVLCVFRTPSRLKGRPWPLLNPKGWHGSGALLLLLLEPTWTGHEGTGPGWGHPMGLTGECRGGLLHAQANRLVGPAMLLWAVGQKPSCFSHSIHQNANAGSMPCSIPPLNQLLQQPYESRLN